VVLEFGVCACGLSSPFPFACSLILSFLCRRKCFSQHGILSCSMVRLPSHGFDDFLYTVPSYIFCCCPFLFSSWQGWVSLLSSPTKHSFFCNLTVLFFSLLFVVLRLPIALSRLSLRTTSFFHTPLKRRVLSPHSLFLPISQTHGIPSTSVFLPA